MNSTPVNIAVLGSTRGTDLQAILDAQLAGKLEGAEVKLVVSNNAEAYILERAEQAAVPTAVIPSKGKTRQQFDDELLELLKQHYIDLIILIGFMRILGANFVEHYPNRIMNIHPSLLPKYSGGMNMDVHAEVLKNRDTVSGCTLHYVTPQVDEGPIIVQEEVPVLPDDTPESLKQRVQTAEQVALLKGIDIFVAKHAAQ